MRQSRFFFPSLLLIASLTIFFADQYFKFYFNNSYLLYQKETVNAFLSWTLVYNPGAAFSFLSDANGWQRWLFISIALIVSIILFFLILRVRSDKLLAGIAYALILGGALGNLYDRIILGYVIDFILVHYKTYYFPAFNGADIAISCGIVCMILDEVLNSVGKKN